MKVVTLIAALILIAGTLIIFVPLILENLQSSQFMSHGLNQIGDFFASAGITNVAETAYDNSLQIDADNIESLTDKANLLASIGNKIEAIALYKKVLNKTPNNLYILNKQMNLLKSLGNKKEVNDLQKKIASAGTPGSSTGINTIKSLISSGDNSAAINKIDELLPSDPNNAELWELKGDAYFGLANSDKSLKNQITDIEASDKSFSDITTNILEKNQLISEGITSYQQALTINPMKSTDISEKIFQEFNGFGVIIDSGKIMQDIKNF